MCFEFVPVGVDYYGLKFVILKIVKLNHYYLENLNTLNF